MTLKRKRPILPTEQEMLDVASNRAVVYFIACEGKVKVGTTTGLRRRLYTIRTSCPYPVTLIGVIYGGAAMEAKVHADLAQWRTRGEWFSLVTPVAAYIRREGYWPIGKRFYLDAHRESQHAAHG